VTGRLVTAREVAELLGVSTGALLRWTRRGEIPAVKLPGGAVRYRPDAIEAWLAEHEMGAVGEEASTTARDRTRPRSLRDATVVDVDHPAADRGPERGGIE
jgi:excisionase family DNA binding protein